MRGRTSAAVGIVMLSVPLTGCMADQKRDLASCVSAKTGVQACAESKGYYADFKNNHCSPLVPEEAMRDPYCYRPHAFLANIGTGIEKFFANPPPEPPAAKT
jgi:hypothetical protein